MRVDIWGDIVCPWCYIGERRFARGLAGFEHHDEVDVVYRSFELDPSIPKGQATPVLDRALQQVWAGEPSRPPPLPHGG